MISDIIKLFIADNMKKLGFFFKLVIVLYPKNIFFFFKKLSKVFRVLVVEEGREAKILLVINIHITQRAFSHCTHPF